MRRIIFILFSFLSIQFFSFISYSYTYNCYNVSVYLNTNGKLFEEIDITLDKKVDTFNYFLLHPAEELSIFSNNNALSCDIKYVSLGTLISCKNVNSNNFHISASFSGLIEGKQTLFLYRDKFIITNIVKEFSLKVFLPEGYVLARNTSLYSQYPFSPEWGKAKSDGRRIYVEWNSNPSLGDTYYIEVFFEKASGIPKISNYKIVPLLFLIILFLLALFLFLPKEKNIYAYLDENERKIVEVLKKYNKKATQKKLCVETDFSKAQVSRILHNLEKRGIIERIKKGRSYEVILKL